MMGRQTTAERLFYDFCLEDPVPPTICCGRSIGRDARSVEAVL
jgi:hypothetical protein